MSVDQLLADGWVKHGHRWVNPRMEIAAGREPTVEPAPRPAVVDGIPLTIEPQRVVAQRTCSDCGCLIHPGEACPACRWTVLRWCEDVAIQHSWAPIPYAPHREAIAA